MYVVGTVDRLLFVELNFTVQHWLTDTSTDQPFCPSHPLPGELPQQKVDLSLIMVSVLSHYLFDKEEIVLSSNKTEFSSLLGERAGEAKPTSWSPQRWP